MRRSIRSLPLLIGVLALALPGMAEARGFKFRPSSAKPAAKVISVAPTTSAGPSALGVGAAAYVGARLATRRPGEKPRDGQHAAASGEQPLPAWFKVPPPEPAASAAPPPRETATPAAGRPRGFVSLN